MSRLRKLRRKVQNAKIGKFSLEQLEPRLLLSADLSVDGFGVDEGLTPPPFMWGDSLSLFTNLSNLGDMETGAFGAKIILSPDANPDPGDYELHLNPSMDSIAAGAGGVAYDTSVMLNNPDTWPDGDYNLIFDAEVTGDGNMANNGMGVMIHIGEGGGPPPAGIDLLAEEFGYEGTSPFNWGEALTLAADIRNVGDTDSGAFNFDILFSTDNMLDGSDTVLDSVSSNSVAPGQVGINDVSVTLPASGTDDEHYLILNIDPTNAVTEVDENNNVMVIPIGMDSGGPPPGGIELHVDDFFVNITGPVLWGDTVNIDADVVNIGDTEAGAFTVQVLFSEDDMVDGGDTEIHSYPVVSLAGGQLYAHNFDYTLPASGADGQYHLIMVADSGDEVTEISEEDNVGVLPLWVGQGGPPADGVELTATEFQINSMGPFNWGDEVDLFGEVQNVGNLDSGAFDVTVWLSQDDMLDGGDTALDTITDVNMVAGGSWSNNLSVTLPGTGVDGDYFLILEADSGKEITEPSEEDNAILQMIHIGAGGGPGGDIDLAAETGGDFLPPYDLVWGEQYEIAVDAFNLSDSEVGAFTISVVLSVDGAYDAGDYLLTEVPVTDLPPYAESINDVMITLPTAGTFANGAYNVIIFVDSGEAIEEVDENNNIAVQSTNIADVPNLVPGIDLAVMDFDDEVEGPYQWGESYPLTADIINLGDTEAGSFTLAVALSEDMNYDISDTPVGEQQVASLAAGATSINDVTITLPAAGGEWTDGPYFLVLAVDSEDAATEADETNNFDDMDIYIGAGGGPGGGIELQADNLFINFTGGPVMWGDTINIDADVRNAGDTEAGTFTVQVLFSEDNMADGGDTEVYSYQVAALAADQVDARNFDYTLPASGVDGEYFLILVADSEKIITEISEEDNYLIIPIYIGEGGPPIEGAELEAFNLQINGMGPFNWGDDVDTLAEAENIGNLETGAFDITIWLSQDDMLDGGDNALETFTGVNLAGGAAWSHNQLVTLPASGTDGDYYLILEADSGQVIAEQDESNNVFIQMIHIGSGGGPGGIDLVADDEEFLPPFGMLWGEQYELPIDAFNPTDGDAGAFTISVVLSADDVYDPGDYSLAQVQVSGLGPWGESINDVMVTLPTVGTFADGDYYVIYFVDSGQVVEEIDENNNLAVQMTSITEQPVLTPGIDLAVLEFDDDVEGNWLWGQGYTVMADVVNLGDTDAGSFTIAIALSADMNYDVSDTEVGIHQVSSLAAGAMSNNDVMITLPEAGGEWADGPYFLVMAVDSENTVAEAEEANNFDDLDIYIGAGGGPGQGVELQADNLFVDLSGGPVMWGDTISIDADVINVGDQEAGSFTVRVLFSQDDMPDGGDIEIYTYQVAALGPGQIYYQDFDYTLPASWNDGQYYLIMVADSENTVVEVNENDNDLIISIYIGEGGPAGDVDLVADDEDFLPPIGLIWGQEYELPVDAFNPTDGGAGAFTISVVLSMDNVYDGGDYSLAQVQVPGLGPWGESINDVMVTLPAAGTFADGDYYVIIFVDSGQMVEEINENNNITVQMTSISEQPNLIPGIDLAVLEFDDDAEGDMLWGQSYPVAADVVNLGDTDAGSFMITVALSTDMNYDVSDTPVATHQVPSLAAGATSINDLTITLPAAGGAWTDGMYYLVLAIDSENAVAEVDEANNYDDVDTYIGAGGGPGGDVDLVGDDEPFTLPMDLVWGEQYEVGLDAYNESDSSVGPFTIRMVVSVDAVYDVTDLELAAVEVGGLGPWEGTEDDEVMITLPAAGQFPDGDYYGIFFVDSDNVIAETDETNNISVYPVHVVTTPNWAAGVELKVFEFEPDMDFPGATEMDWGQYFWADVGVVNIGDTDATAFNIRILLSEDELVDASDMELGTIPADGLNSGKMDFFEEDLMLPGAGIRPDGTYYILAQADSDNIFTETNENNNTGGYSVYIEGGGGPQGDADLSVAEFGFIGMGPFGWDEDITLYADINNYGYGEAGPFDVKVFLSEHADPYMGGYLLLHHTIQGLPAGGFSGNDWPVTLPPMGTMPDGEYNLILVVDSENTVSESDEYNNVSLMPIFIGAEPPVEGIDLRAHGPFIPDMIDLVWGGTYQVGADAKNAGDTPAGAFTVSVVLSVDDVYDSGDAPLAQVPLPGLSGLSEFFNDVSITLPQAGVHPDGTYYIMVVADSNNAVEEVYEDNNVSLQMVEISATADLVAGVDLGTMTFDLGQMQGDLAWGRSYMAAADVMNMGDTDAGQFTISIALSNDGIFSANDMIVGTVPVYSLGSGDMMINDVLIELPAPGAKPDGPYYLIMEVDSNKVIVEADEANNSMFLNVNIITDAGGEPGEVDLQVNSIMLPPPPLVYNGFLAIQTEIANTMGGSVNSPFTVGLYVSEDSNIDQSDWLIGDTNVYGMAGEEIQQLFINVQFPPEGIFATNNLYLGAVVDSWSNVEELDESNNTYVTNLMLETPMVPEGIDLTVMFHQWPGQISEAETIEVMYEVHNFGDAAAGTFTVEFYLSMDPMVNLEWMDWPTGPGMPGEPGEPGEPADDDILLTAVEISALNPGEMLQETIMLTLPEVLEHDFYHLIAVADADAVIEDSFRENNFGVVFVNVMQSGLDLNWHDMFLPFDLQWGQTFTVDALINNWSAQDVMAAEVAFYLSEDYELDGGDELLGSVNLTDLFGGSMAQASLELTLPDDRQGEAMLRIIGQIDPDEVLDEFDIYNNIWIRDIYIGMPQLANLMAWPMIMFEPAPGGGGVDWGGSINVDTGVHNGSDVRTGPFNVSYYLSANQSLDGVVATLHTEPIPNGLYPFENYFQTVTLTMPAEDPGGSPGEWFILAQADSDNVIVEFDEMDNVGWAPIFVGSMPPDLGGWMEVALAAGVSVQWGEPVPLNGQIENWGGSDAGPFEVSYYLTSDPEINANDYLLATQTIELLAAESGTPVPESLILPADPGQFGSGTVFIVALIDSGEVVEEIDEWNNFMGDWLTAETAMTELIPFHLRPDWQAFWNQPMQVEYGLGNIGNLDAESVVVSILLGSEDFQAAQTYEIFRETISLPADSDYFNMMAIELPDPSAVSFVIPGEEDGMYRLIMRVDPDQTIEEIIENNNQFDMMIHLEAMRGMIQVQHDDFNPQDMVLDLGPTPAEQSISGTFTISNRGMGTLNVSDIIIENPDFAVTYNGAAVTGDYQIPPFDPANPAEPLTFEVTFSGTMQGPNWGRIRILNDDPGWSEYILDARADVVAAPVDLSVSAIQGPASAYWGNPITLNVGIANLQAGEAEQARLELLLSEKADWTGMVMPLTDQMITAIAGNASITQPVQITLPTVSPFGYGGALYLKAIIHPTGNSFDANYANNERAVPIQITNVAVGKPDLSFTWLWLNDQAQQQDELEVRLGVRNFGSADAGAFNIKYYLSPTDDILDAADTLLGETSMAGLSKQSEKEVVKTVVLPELEQTEGILHLLIQIDADNTVKEDFEGNNLAVARFQKEAAAMPDLSADYLTLETAEVTVGNPVNVELQVSSTAPEPINHVRVEFFLHEPGQPEDFFGMYLGSLPVSIAAESSTIVQFSSILPEGAVQADGDNQYQVMAFIDANHMFFESDEENNMILSTETFLASAGNIDLTATIDNAPAEATWEQPLSFEVTVTNTGDLGAPPFFVDLFLSSDDQLDFSDFYLSSRMIFTLGPAGSQTLVMDVILPGPLPPGTGEYFLLAEVDGGQTVIETDEDNLVGSALTISGTPDLAVFWAQAPNKGNFAQTITVTDRVENRGNAAVEQGQFEINYYLSADMVFDELDVLLGSRAITSLALQGATTANTELTLPAEGDEGPHYLLAKAEAIGEAVDETPGNNMAAWPLQLISNGMPDLKAAAISTAAEEADWGDTVSVSNTVTNIGAANAGEFVAAFYLSDNNSITSQDILLGTRTITSLAAGGSNTTSKTLTLPSANPYGQDGEFYIGMMVDSQGKVAETNEANNKLVAASPITIGDVITVDLMAALAAGPPIGMVGDETIEVYYEVFNAGTTNAGQFDIDFYLTGNGIIDESALPLDSVTVNSLGAGAWATNTAQLPWPAQLDEAAGESFIMVMEVNAAQNPAEKTFANNIARGLGTFRVAAPVETDIFVVGADADDEAQWGDAITVQYQLQTTGVVNGPIGVGFYLSGTTGLTGSMQLGQAEIDMAGLNMYDGLATLNLPDESPFGRDGQLFVIVAADPQNSIEEGDDNNNRFSTPLIISSGGADLVGVKIAGVPAVSTGQSFDVYNELANFGSEETDDFYVCFYLTGDNAGVNVDADTYLGMRQVNSLAGGAVNWTITTLTIPASGVVNGEYYLAMYVDRFDDIEENSELNNTVFSVKPVKVYSAGVAPDECEPNNNSGGATVITFDAEGETIGQANNIPATLTLHNSQDRDYYRFTAPADPSGENSANGFARLTLIPTTAVGSPDTLNIAVRVDNTTNSSFVGGADTDASLGGDEIFTTFSIIPGYSYSVLVKPVGDSFGGYMMDLELGIGPTGDSYESNNTQATAYYLGSAAKTLPDPNTTTPPPSIHNATDLDYYKFAVPATSTGKMTVAIDPDPTLDAILQIYNASGALLASADTGGADAAETLTVTGAVGANYYAKVSSWASSTGAYQFNLSFTRAQQPDSYETNNSFAAAYALTGNVLASPTIHNGDVDYYDITGMLPEGTMAVEAYLYGSAGLDAGLALYVVLQGDTESLIRSANRTGVNGNEVLKANVEDYGGEQLILAVNSVNDTTGCYSLELAYNDEDIGDFAEPNQQRTTAYAVALNQSGRAGLSDLSLHNANDRDYYSFIAPAQTDGAAVVMVTPDDTAVDLNVSLRLLDQAGNVLKATDATGAGDVESLMFNSVGSGLVAGQRYYLDVNGWGTVGNYQLNLHCPLADTAFAQADQNSYDFLTDYYQSPRFSTVYKFDGTPPEIRVIEQVANDNDDDLSFGAVPVGSSLSYTFEVLNTGGSTLQIGAGDMTIVGDGSSVFSVEPTFADIAQGGSQEFTVTFTPGQLRLYLDTTLQIVSNDPDDSPYELTLSGTGIVSADKPDIALVDEQNTGSLESLGFGDVLIDDEGTMYFRIVNFGSASLTVSAVQITGANADAFTNVFTNLPNKSSDNYTIAAGGQKLIQVDFNPTADGLHAADMTLTSNDPDETSVVIPLTGTGVQPDLVVDLTPDDQEVANPLNYIIGFGNQVADGPGNQQALRPLKIWNLGTSTLTITSVGLQQGTSFSISGVAPAGFEIEPGQSVSATVVFDPATAGSSFTDSLTISSDDFETPNMQFNLTGQASQAFSTTIEAGGAYAFTDSDGDSVNIALANGSNLSAVVTFDGSAANGSDIADISITGAVSSSSLIITVTHALGDNAVAIGNISIAGAGFGTVQIGGSADSLTVAGAIKTVTLSGELGGFSADGVVTSFTTGGLSGTVSADAFKTISVNGNMSGAQISTDPEYKGSAISILNVTGNISDNTTIDTGMIKRMEVAGAISDTAITTSGAKSQVGALTVGGGVDNLTINTAKMKTVTVNSDLLNSSFTLDSAKASIKALSVAGDADLDLAVSGTIKKVTVAGDLAGQIDATGAKGSIKSVDVGADLSAALSAVKSIKTINAGSDITSAAITILGTGKGSIGNLTAGGSVNVGDIDVDGTIKKMTVGSAGSGNLSGNVSAGIAINKVDIFGDIFGSLEAGRKINTITASGDLKSGASITCAEGNITKLFITDNIQGSISANNGAGRIKQVLRPNSFADPDTGLVNSYADHIDAQLAKINWKDL